MHKITYENRRRTLMITQNSYSNSAWKHEKPTCDDSCAKMSRIDRYPTHISQISLN